MTPDNLPDSLRRLLADELDNIPRPHWSMQLLEGGMMFFALAGLMTPTAIFLIVIIAEIMK